MPWAPGARNNHNRTPFDGSLCSGLEFLLGDRVASSPTLYSQPTLPDSHESAPASKAKDEVAEGLYRHPFQLKANLASENSECGVADLRQLGRNTTECFWC